MPTVTVEIPDLPDIERNGVMYEFSGEVRPVKKGERSYLCLGAQEYTLMLAGQDSLSLNIYPIARPKKWVPVKGLRYEYIGSMAGTLAVHEAVWYGDEINRNRLKQGNAYEPGTGAAQADFERMLAARKGNEE